MDSIKGAERGVAIDEQLEFEPRIFTLQEACELLPVLRDLLARFRQAHEAGDEAYEALAVLERQRSRSNMLELARPLRQHRENLGFYVAQMRDVLRSALALGVEIKAMNPGLIDFRSVRDGQEIYLCWQEGEETISFWHTLHGGFAGRQRL